REAARGQGLRLRQVPALSPPLRDQEPHRSARHRVQRTAGPPPLGGRAHAGVVQPLPAPGRTLRETRRHPRSLPLTRQCPHLPGLPREGVLIDTLSDLTFLTGAGFALKAAVGARAAATTFQWMARDAVFREVASTTAVYAHSAQAGYYSRIAV